MIDLRLGDCLEVMATLPANSVDSCITDSPYGLKFMGKDWDHGIPGVAYWCEVLRVLKPGAFLLAFGGTRTSHRLTCAIEDAGFEIRDSMAWIYGQGFPKSHDISKGIDKAAGVEREVTGQKIDISSGKPMTAKQARGGAGKNINEGWDRPWRHDDAHTNQMTMLTSPSTELAQQFDGYGTALKPAIEPIVVAMKPTDGTFAANAEKWGVAGLWIDGGRIETTEKIKPRLNGRPEADGWGLHLRTDEWNSNSNGRWPANLILDETTTAMLDEQEKNVSRFFYVAKASKAERGEGNDHPTVKPLTLMRYLCRLTRPPSGGVVLDPFMGSGTTGIAAAMEGRDFIGIEKHPPYFEIAERRIGKAQPEPQQGALAL